MCAATCPRGRGVRHAATVAAHGPTHCTSAAAAATSIRSGASATAALLRPTRVCLYRNVTRNTLADTPSGYIQDPRAGPTSMPRYDSVSRVGAAALEAMERERELLEREELAYNGYTTLRIQALKEVVLNNASTPAELQPTATALEEELAALSAVVGQEVEKPMSTQRLLLLKWQQRQQRLQDRENAFQVPVPQTPAFRVVAAPDGAEVLERPGRDTALPAVHETDDAYLSQNVEAEELKPEALVLDTTVVTVADVNHVRYLLGLTYRRLGRFEEAEKVLYAILAADVTSVDAMESLLEMDTGIEGWAPRIRVLLDYLQVEYTKAVEEGRLQPAVTDRAATAPPSDGGVGAFGSAATTSATTSSSSAVPPGSAPSSALPRVDAAADAELSKAVAAAAPRGTSLTRASPSPPPSSLLTGGEYATLPQVAPAESAMSLLSDLIVEAAGRTCAADGEGATSRFFIEALGPIVRALGREYGPALLEALFRAVDEQHFMARFDSADMPPEARKFAFSLVIAFLKALLARRIHEMLPQPERFQFFTLVKLHAALRSSARLHESYTICEQMMRLYRAHSSVYRARVLAMTSAAPRQMGAPSSAFGEHHGAAALEDEEGHVQALPSEGGADVAAPAVQSPVYGDSTDASGASSASPASEPPDVLDDQDANYREALFQYMNDRARDAPVLGRRLCLEAMTEFPRSAAPWETLALLLHKEDPKKNLTDAIVAARRAMELEPLNISVIVTLANLYKAAQRYELHDRMMDRYRLLSYMVEQGASVEDMLATAAEVAALDAETPAAQDLVEETGREMKEFLMRLEQATTYSMPIDKEPRPTGEGPIISIAQQADMRPAEVAERDALVRRVRREMEPPALPK